MNNIFKYQSSISVQIFVHLAGLLELQNFINWIF